jgi:hypothetical protein
MSDLNRIRALAGILTESVMDVPSLGNSASVPAGIDEMFGDVDETAPPGMEDMVMDLKKEYPGEPEKAFATAWSIYNKKNGKDESMMEDGALDSIIQQSADRLADMLDSFVDYNKAVDTLTQELQGAGHSAENIEEILNGVNNWFKDEASPETADDNEDDGYCHTCDGTGEGQYDGTRCSACGGSGVLHSNDPEDFDDPDSGFDDMDEGIELGDSSLGMPAYYIINGHTNAVSAGPFNSYSDAICSDDAKRWITAGSHIIEYGMEDDDGQFTPADINESLDLNNGYDDIKFMNPGDFFPDGADSPVTSATGTPGAKQGDNPEQKKMAVAETHKELVYNYRKFLKESAKK